MMAGQGARVAGRFTDLAHAQLFQPAFRDDLLGSLQDGALRSFPSFRLGLAMAGRDVREFRPGERDRRAGSCRNATYYRLPTSKYVT